MEDVSQMDSSLSLKEKFPVLVLFLMVFLTLSLSVMAGFVVVKNLLLIGESQFVNIVFYSFLVGIIVGLVGLIRAQYLMSKSLIVSFVYLVLAFLFFRFVVRGSEGKILTAILLSVFPFFLSNTIVPLVVTFTKKIWIVAIVLTLLIVGSFGVYYAFIDGLDLPLGLTTVADM